MMAKMFYTLDEAKAALGKNEEEIKQLSREGRLREFRDGPRLMFKADQVEQLKAEVGGGGDAGIGSVDLGPSDSGAPLGLADSRGMSGTGLSLADTDGGRSPGAGMQMKEDTALAADLGLSGSLGGMPSPRGVGGSGASMAGGSAAGLSMGGSASGSRGGINVFGADDSIAHADPMAQTAISSGIAGGDQVNLEGVGSGSGLLDLTRESDDTSLGAELLDEIGPGKQGSRSGSARARTPGESGIGTGVARAIEGTGVSRVGLAPVTYREAPDASAGAFGGAALGAALFSLLGGLVLASAVVGVTPKKITDLGDMGLLTIFGVGAGVAIIFAIVGLLVGRSLAR